ncbi:MAG: leucine-rich repeat domain-containing protein [Mycoplasmoidaceae bacterium]
MKPSLLLKKIGFLVATTSAPLAGCVAISASDSFWVSNRTKIIPPGYLSLSSDGKTLNGFKENITVRDIQTHRYTTLQIPNNVETIAPYAFSYMFGDDITEVSTIILNNDLQTIGDGAFKNCSNIESVNFNEIADGNLKYIGKESFAGCGIIRSIDIPKHVETIGDYAFSYCTHMDGNIFIPSSVTKVGVRAFAECHKLCGLNLLDFEEIPDWLWRNKQIFQNSGQDSKKYNFINVRINKSSRKEWEEALVNRQQLSGGYANFDIIEHNAIDESYLDIDTSKSKHILKGFKTTEIDFESYDALVVPSSVDEIAENAFLDVIKTGNIKLIFSAPLATIHKKAFMNCTGITEIIFNEKSVSEIESSAFENCTNISGSLILDESTLLIESQAFLNCSSLNSLIFDTDQANCEIGFAAFAGCKSLSLIDVSKFPENVMPQNWYNPNQGDERLPFDDICDTGSINIHSEAHPEDWTNKFHDCGLSAVGQPIPDQSSLYYWTINDSFVEPFGPEHYQTIKNATQILGLTDEAKARVRNYTYIQIGDYTEQICGSAFARVFEYDDDYKMYWNLQLNNGIKEISSSAFQHCTGIQGPLILPNSLTTIDFGAFEECSRICGNLILPIHLETIGPYAFDCDYLISNDNLIIPDSVKTIGSYAFRWTKIKKISFGTTIPEMNTENGDSFGSMKELKELNLTKWTIDGFNEKYSGQSKLFYGLWVDSEGEGYQGKVVVKAKDDTEKSAWLQALENNGLNTEKWEIVYE